MGVQCDHIVELSIKRIPRPWQRDKVTFSKIFLDLLKSRRNTADVPLGDNKGQTVTDLQNTLKTDIIAKRLVEQPPPRKILQRSGLAKHQMIGGTVGQGIEVIADRRSAAISFGMSGFEPSSRFCIEQNPMLHAVRRTALKKLLLPP